MNFYEDAAEVTWKEDGIASYLGGQGIAGFSSRIHSIARSGSSLISGKSEDAEEGFIDRQMAHSGIHATLRDDERAATAIPVDEVLSAVMAQLDLAIPVADHITAK